jgi:hypothetical protein
MSENHHLVEMHGCIVCGRVFNILVVYTPEDKMVDCKVTSPGGHRLADEERPLVACDSHTQEEIARDYIRWQTKMSKESEKGQGDE